VGDPSLIALLQRVSEARVQIAGELAGSIGRGLLALVGVRPTDRETDALRLLDRMLKYRVFADERGKMNLNLQQIAGDLLLVPQFTLAADTRHGLRPGFSTAAPPEQGKRLFESLVSAAHARHTPVASGVFGAHMQVLLINDGPVTFWLES
jgi:D-aminoacyl-tRNA deacylase